MDLPSSTAEAPIRALAFDLQGQWLMAAGDDKHVKVWQLPSMVLQCEWCVAKSSPVSPAALLTPATCAMISRHHSLNQSHCISHGFTSWCTIERWHTPIVSSA